MLTQEAGITIPAYLHLPAAVEFEVEDLEWVDEAVLIKLQLDCVEWRIAVEEQRDAIRTPPAMTEWNVLVKMEVAMVIAAHDRIADERRYRRMLADRPRTIEGS